MRHSAGAIDNFPPGIFLPETIGKMTESRNRLSHWQWNCESRETRTVRIFATCLVTTGLCLLPWRISAEEPAQAFLEALRENGYYDVAVDYLDRLETSDLITEDFRKILPFEKAETLIASTATLRDLNVLESRLDEAQKLLNDYAGKVDSADTLALTLRYQGNLFYQRAKVYGRRGGSDRLTANEKEAFDSKARQMLQGSLKCYEDAKLKIKSLIDPNSPDAIKIDVEDPSTTANLKQFQTLYTQVRIRLPMVIEQLADTYPSNSPDRVKLLEDAIREYNDVYDDYYKYPAGLDARLFAARCSQKLGDHKQALILLEDIFNLNDSSALKILKRKAFMLASESWNQTEPYPFNEVLARLQPVVSVLNSGEVRQSDWLRIQMELAIATHRKAAAVKEKGGPKANSDSKALDREAAKILRNVARIPGENRDEARQLLTEWNIPIADVASAEETPPETFADARQKARDYTAEIETLLSDQSRLKRQLTAATNEQQKSATQSELDETVEQINKLSTLALNMLDQALTLVDDSTLRADINNVRYLQSFCYFATQQYFESALICEFLLSKYPSVDGTRQAMTLLIQSYSQLHDLAGDQDKSYEKNRLKETCMAVVDRWPGSKEAGSAASTMTRLAINDNDFATAEEYFAQIPQNIDYRGSLATRLGQRMWFNFKSESQQVNAESNSEIPAEVQNAKSYLEIGLRESTLDNLDYDSALGALLLVDVLLESNDVEQAVQRLETAEIAPLDLVKQKHPAITDTPMAPVYRRETYKIAVKAYLAAMQATSDQQEWIGKISGILAAMRNEMEASNDPKDRERLTAIYRKIAKELKRQFEELASSDDKKKFAGNLASFLESIEKDSQDAKTVLWAGSTLLGVANSLRATLPDEAKPLFAQAVSALNRAESLGFQGDPQEAAMNSELKRQRAWHNEAAVLTKKRSSNLPRSSKRIPCD